MKRKKKGRMKEKKDREKEKERKRGEFCKGRLPTQEAQESEANTNSC